MLGANSTIFLGLFVVLVGVLLTSIFLNLRGRERVRGLTRSLGRKILSWTLNHPIPLLLVGLFFSTFSLGISWRQFNRKSIWLEILFILACLPVFFESRKLLSRWLLIRHFNSSRRQKNRWLPEILVRVLPPILMIATLYGLTWFSFKYWPQSTQLNADKSAADEKALRELVQASQLYEVRTIYADPGSFNPSQLSKYWVPSNQGGRAAEQINASVARLHSADWHYGTESSPENFEILSVTLNEPVEGNAIVLTSERWFLPLYRRDGTRVLERNAYLGPFLVRYMLRKVNGTWLIQDNNTPYSTTPSL